MAILTIASAHRGTKLPRLDSKFGKKIMNVSYSSTTVQEIQAESLFFLASGYHVREDNYNSHKLYECAKLAI